MSTNPQPAGVTGYPNTAHPVKPRRSSSSVRLPAELGVDQADSLKEQLLKAVERDQAVTLDASDVQRIHTAALQLFCMFCRDRRAAGREVRWHKPSDALRSAAALLGATTLLSFGLEQEHA
ncbi:MAG: STAS domain-containing protein [Nevskiaceae bacterium]|nr:MAG: STAS domain-containing protein [Nevskiaceae bacterium]